MSTRVKKSWLRLLAGVGVKNFRATSGLGYPYICHLGDFVGEVPFYNLAHSRAEILVMAEWCRHSQGPVIFDIGANLGFVCTQLAQALNDRAPQIFAFEPVPSTFSKLASSIQELGLESMVLPICCAISDIPGLHPIAYNPRESLFAQMRNDQANLRAGTRRAVVPVTTVDAAMESLGVTPNLVKVDVEGFEAHVFRGARNLLKGSAAPAILFELNKCTLEEVGSNAEVLAETLKTYRFFYIDDFEGQRRNFGSLVEDLGAINWACNLFAIPINELASDQWSRTFEAVKREKVTCDSPGDLTPASAN